MATAKFLDTLCTYNIKIGNGQVKTTVLEHQTQLENCIEDLRSSLGSMPMVGLDVKTGTVQRSIYGWKVEDALVLILSSKERCLIIPVGRLLTLLSPLVSFLHDTSIYFRCQDASRKTTLLEKRLSTHYDIILASATDVRPFVGRILRNPALSNLCRLVELGNKIGMDLKEEKYATGRNPDWVNLCLSEEDIKMTINEAYMCYALADFAMKKLNKSGAN